MTCAQPNSHFLVEWYWPNSDAREFDATIAHLADVAASAAGQVLVSVLVGADEVAFAIVDAQSAVSVAQICHRAGVPAQRLTPVQRTRIAQASLKSTSTGA